MVTREWKSVCWLTQYSTLVGSHRAGRMCRCLLGRVSRALLYNPVIQTEPSFFFPPKVGVCSQQDQNPAGALGAILLENHPQIQSKTKAKRTDLCGSIFPCVWLHACLGGEAGVVTGLWRRAAQCRSVSLGCGLCGRAAIGIFWWPAPAGAPGAMPHGSTAPSTIIPVLSSLFSCFPVF